MPEEIVAVRGIAHNYYADPPYNHPGAYFGCLWDEKDSAKIQHWHRKVEDVLRQHEGELVEIIVRPTGVIPQPRHKIVLLASHTYGPVPWDAQQEGGDTGDAGNGV